ncbi:hypothetical protein VC83_08995 [Pseudogymnoascus destructans]|uniref:Mmc1 C-terminal domain-containing protein n=2 Tax=Pseudogymnoascus destructans TaxID=655981 RepID=A0A177A0E0_9PEZI|nr:uncharacterized protein VC83_08995 [Pseudogymnoascus destructans]OAF54751.1 hypothetical protein VC83_08995 [Pseudogymnoascus destructans]
MPPRLPRLAPGRLRLARTNSLLPKTSKCLLCQFNAAPAAAGKQVPCRREQVGTTAAASIPRARRQLSTATVVVEGDGEAKPLTPKQVVAELEKALSDLEKQAVGYVNLPRLRLAQRGVAQRVGQEVIRVAVIALAGQGKSTAKSRELIRLLLADPLKAEEEWERSLTATEDPVLLRISHRSGGNVEGGGAFKNRLLKEVQISSAMLKDHYLEILVIDGDVLMESEEGTAELAENVLVPNIQIPASFGAHYSPITAPVHKALIVGDGILGAASLLRLPSMEADLIQTAVDLPSSIHDTAATTQFHSVDVSLGTAALRSFRENVGNALKYEQQWSASGLPTLRDWVISGSSSSTTSSSLKPPVHALIRSLLSSTEEKIHCREASALSAALSARVSPSTTQSLQRDLDEWAEGAHTELRDQLDLAFSGRRWRALAWWKLFWRVDDVSAITSDILASRFLTGAEQEVIYIAGKIDAAGVLAEPTTPQPSSANWAYKDAPPIRDPEEEVPLGIEPEAAARRVRDVIPVIDTPLDGPIATPAIKAHPWPLHIPLTRSYIATSSVPRLQALAQKLVAQTLGTTAFSGAFAGLIYVSNLSVGIYEAGAVAALGTVWALRRMQGGWEGGGGGGRERLGRRGGRRLGGLRALWGGC